MGSRQAPRATDPRAPDPAHPRRIPPVAEDPTALARWLRVVNAVILALLRLPPGSAPGRIPLASDPADPCSRPAAQIPTPKIPTPSPPPLLSAGDHPHAVTAASSPASSAATSAASTSRRQLRLLTGGRANGKAGGSRPCLETAVACVVVCRLKTSNPQLRTLPLDPYLWIPAVGSCGWISAGGSLPLDPWPWIPAVDSLA